MGRLGPVRSALDEIPQRVAHSGRLEQPRRKLVEERLERVVVVPVDEDDVHVRLLQLPGSPDAREASSEDEDPRTRIGACRTAHPGTECHIELAGTATLLPTG